MPAADPKATPPAKNGDGNGKKNGNGEKNGKEEEPKVEKQYGFLVTFLRTYPTLQDWFPKCLDKDPPKKEGEEEAEPEPPRRGLPAPFSAPFPAQEWQIAPVIGAPLTTSVGPLQAALYTVPGLGDFMKDYRIRTYGWINGSINSSTNKFSNGPDSYWLSANRIELDQAVLKIEREVDSVQKDHVDWGFRSCGLYGQDYRFTTAGGWGADQLLVHNNRYGWDPIEQYFDVYIPYIADGVILRTGRWVACPDIETQLAPDNYMGTHSILFTFDTYTQTGQELTVKLNDHWTVQVGYNFGDDMAPWYKNAPLCGFAGVRWVSEDNHDSVYTCLNQIDSAQFRHFTVNGQPAGHDNYNYVVSTYQHKFSDNFLTKQEGYFMWQRNAEVGGSPSLGPVEPYGGGGGDAPTIPGITYTYGTVNYTCYKLNKLDFVTFRNEIWRDDKGMRSGFPGTYSSHSIGLSHNFTDYLQVRPEVGYYRNYNNPAFDNGQAKGCWIAGADCTIKF